AGVLRRDHLSAAEGAAFDLHRVPLLFAACYGYNIVPFGKMETLFYAPGGRGPAPMKKNLLVTGLPGTGKTTLIRKILDTLPPGVSVSGFFTAEIRESGERVGFAVSTLDGRSGLLAHVRAGGRARVGRYGVD